MLLNIFETCDIFQDPMRNKKLKRTVFIKNINFVTIYTIFKSLGSVHFFFPIFFIFFINTFIQQGCVKGIQMIVKTYIARKYLYF